MITASAKKLHIGIASLFLIVISLPIYFTRKIGLGDLLFMESVSVNLFKEGGSWNNWAFTPSPAYVPDVFAYFLSYFLLPSAADRIYFVSLLQIFLIALTSLFVIRTISYLRTASLTLLVFSILGYLSYLSYSSDIWLFFNATNNHIGVFIFGFCALAALYNSLQEGKPVSNFFWLYAWALLGLISGSLMLVWFFAPAIASCLLVILGDFFFTRSISRRTVIAILILFSAFITHHYTVHFYQVWDPVRTSGRGNPSLEAFYQSFNYLKQLKGWLFVPFRFDFIPLYLIIAIGFTSAIVQIWKLLRQPALVSSKQGFLLVFSLACPVTTFVAIALVGEWYSIDRLRYLLFPSALFCIFTIVRVRQFACKFLSERSLLLTLNISLGIAAFLTIISFQTNKESLAVRIENQRQYRDTTEWRIAQCLDAHSKTDNLKSGVSDFWYARSTTLLSKTGLRVSPVTGSVLAPRQYMSTIGWFLGEHGTPYSNPVYNFVIADSVYIPAAKVEDLWGLPTSEFDCPGFNGKILVYDQTTRFDERLKQLFTAVTNNLFLAFQAKRQVTYPANVIQNISGEKTEKGITASPNSTHPGLMTIGPYVHLAKGIYRLALSIETPDTPSKTVVGSYDVFSHPATLNEKRDIAAGEHPQLITDIFSVSKSDAYKPFEVRLWYSGTGTMVLTSLGIEKLE